MDGRRANAPQKGGARLTITKRQATEAARAFVRDYVRAGRAWGNHVIGDYLPRGFRIRPDAYFRDRPTIETVAAFLRREAFEG